MKEDLLGSQSQSFSPRSAGSVVLCGEAGTAYGKWCAEVLPSWQPESEENVSEGRSPPFALFRHPTYWRVPLPITEDLFSLVKSFLEMSQTHSETCFLVS